MIYHLQLKCTQYRDEVIQYILKKKAEGPFRVIDVGGSIGGWSMPYIDALFDFQTPEMIPTNIEYFHGDMTHPDAWKEIHSYVEEHEKFDFCICTHTLEDIMNPGYVCEQMSKISTEGYIAVPSKYIELSRIAGLYRGYIHHRWIFVVRDGKFIGYPKLNFIEYMDVDKYIQEKTHYDDVSFFWKDNISVTYLNNNYMGPRDIEVIQYFNTLLMRDDYD